MAENKNPGAPGGTHQWRFFRCGGFDQVHLASGADLMALDELDQKLWAALACPTSHLEFDDKTLQLIDVDGDQRIRPPEVIAAVKWAGSLLRDPDDLTRSSVGLPLAAIDDSKPEGHRVLDSAREILKNLGKPDAADITVEDTADTATIFAETKFNGDGVVPVASAEDQATAAVIEDIMVCVGSEIDRSGRPGISEPLIEKFFEAAESYDAWWQGAEQNAEQVLPFGVRTPEVASVFESLKAKVDDYFTRCRLAEFDARAIQPLNPARSQYEALSPREISSEDREVSTLPLASIEPGKALPLKSGVNPAWAEAVEMLRTIIVEPLMGDRDRLAAEEWATIAAKFAAHEAWLSAKQGESVEPLGLQRVREILASGARDRLLTLIQKDKDLEEEADAIASVDRLVRYHRDLFVLLNNFVSFRDFYTASKKAIFQAGTLYLDGRACELCVKVDDIGKHSSLAHLSRTYLAYCECARKGSDKRMSIVAAFTEGDADNLMVGRNGVFYDREGRDWDATIVKLVEHPISIRQAFWAPYKRIARMISEQAEKFAAAREKDVEAKAAAGVSEVAAKAEEGKAPAAAPFDVAKFAGIFAAIGLAIGAIGTAVASVVTGFLGLTWWQMPLGIAGLILVVSGPSMLIAYLKLRNRNLAPILDANGWAVNTRAMINIPFGASLTSVGVLPRGAQRSLSDPFAEKKRPWTLYLVLLALLLAVSFLWHKGYLQSWWDAYAPPAVKQVLQPSAPADPAADASG